MSVLSKDDPQGAGHSRTEVFPSMRRAAVEEGTVSRLQRMAAAVVVQRNLALDDVEELHLARLDDDLLRLHSARPRGEGGDHRADLAVEESCPQDGPSLRGALERHDGIVLLASDLDAAGRLTVEEGRDGNAESGRQLAYRVERRAQTSRLDLRHHARGQAGLLGELPLLELALGPEGPDPLAQRRHATSSSNRPSASSPASRRRARRTKTRVIRLR